MRQINLGVSDHPRVLNQFQTVHNWNQDRDSVLRPGLVVSCTVAYGSSPVIVRILEKMPRYKEWWRVILLSDQSECLLELPLSEMGTLWNVVNRVTRSTSAFLGSDDTLCDEFRDLEEIEHGNQQIGRGRARCTSVLESPQTEEEEVGENEQEVTTNS